jgi:hypothetical protein
MDADPPPAAPATALTARFRQQLLAQRQRVERQASSREPTGLRRTPKLGRDGEKGALASGRSGIGAGRAPTRAASSAQQRPLLPVSERRSQEENIPQRRAKKGSQDDDKWELTPDGGSAGREGRQFAVANVGNNGRIYLR